MSTFIESLVKTTSEKDIVLETCIQNQSQNKDIVETCIQNQSIEILEKNIVTKTTNPDISTIQIASNQGYSVQNPISGYTEDRAFTIKCANSNIIGAGVCDGHGGTPIYAELCSTKFPSYFENELALNGNNISSAIVHALNKLHLDAKKCYRRGGTTFVVWILDPDTNILYTGNLGDSFVMVLEQIDDSYVEIFRTIDHDANSPEEQARVNAIDPTIIFANNYMNVPYSGNIAFTRAVGDFLFDSVLGRNIDIAEIQLDALKKYVIVTSSDGLTEMMTHNPLTNEYMLKNCRDETEIHSDVNTALQLKVDNISEYLIRQKIESCARKFMELYKVTNNFEGWCDYIITNMDNMLIMTYLV
jgi:serine/threonine protein phosphatase PrpC